MPQALDPTTGQAVDVPEADFHAKWQAGEIQPIAGARYQVRLGSGSYGTVPAEGLAAALQGGAQLVAPQEAQAAELDRKYGGVEGGAIAGVGGFASQATLGLSDQALRAVAPGALEAEQQATARHPYASMLGQGLGAAALTAVTGVGGAAEGFGARVTAGAGEGLLARMGTRATVSALRGAAEGAQFGVAQAISDDAIADHKLAAAQVLSTVGSNALWGGALGGAFGAIGGGVDWAKETAARGEALNAQLRGAASEADVKAIAGRVLGVDPAPGLGDKVRGWYSKLASAVSGGDADAIESLTGGALKPGTLGYENRRALLEADEIRNAASRDIRTHVDNILAAGREVQEEGQRSLKRGYIRAAVQDVDAASAARASRDMVDRTIVTLDEMLKSPDDYGGAAPLQRAMKLAQRASDALDESTSNYLASEARGAASEQHGHVGDMFATVDDLKKAIGKYTKGASRLSPGAATDELIALQNRARASKLQGLYEELRTGLEDETVWKKAATDQRAINSAWTTQIDASNRFHRALTTEVGRDPNNPWLEARGVDPAKADAYVRGLMNPAQDLTHKAVTDFVDSSKRLAQTMAEAYELPAEKRAAVASLAKNADAFRTTLDGAEKNLALVNQFEELRHVTQGHATGWLAAAGAMSHGVAGGIGGLAVGKLGGLFTRPADTIMQMAQVERMMRDSDSRMGRALTRLVRGGVADESTSTEAFARKAAQVRSIATDAPRLQQRLLTNTADLRSRAPKLADALVGTTLSGLAYLRDHMPPQAAKDPMDPNRRVPPPSQAAQAQWLRRYDAVIDPTSAVEKLASGRINPEAKDVLQKVYPELFAQAQKIATEQIQDGKIRGLDTQKRMRLGLMLDLPIPELGAGYLMARQATWTMPPTEANEEQQAGAPGKPGRAKVDLGGILPALRPASDRVEMPGLGD